MLVSPPLAESSLGVPDQGRRSPRFEKKDMRTTAVEVGNVGGSQLAHPSTSSSEIEELSPEVAEQAAVYWLRGMAKQFKRLAVALHQVSPDATSIVNLSETFKAVRAFKDEWNSSHDAKLFGMLGLLEVYDPRTSLVQNALKKGRAVVAKLGKIEQAGVRPKEFSGLIQGLQCTAWAFQDAIYAFQKDSRVVAILNHRDPPTQTLYELMIERDPTLANIKWDKFESIYCSTDGFSKGFGHKSSLETRLCHGADLVPTITLGGSISIEKFRAMLEKKGKTPQQYEFSIIESPEGVRQGTLGQVDRMSKVVRKSIVVFQLSIFAWALDRQNILDLSQDLWRRMEDDGTSLSDALAMEYKKMRLACKTANVPGAGKVAAIRRVMKDLNELDKKLWSKQLKLTEYLAILIRSTSEMQDALEALASITLTLENQEVPAIASGSSSSSHDMVSAVPLDVPLSPPASPPCSSTPPPPKSPFASPSSHKPSAVLSSSPPPSPLPLTLEDQPPVQPDLPTPQTLPPASPSLSLTPPPPTLSLSAPLPSPKPLAMRSSSPPPSPLPLILEDGPTVQQPDLPTPLTLPTASPSRSSTPPPPTLSPFTSPSSSTKPSAVRSSSPPSSPLPLTLEDQSPVQQPDLPTPLTLPHVATKLPTPTPTPAMSTWDKVWDVCYAYKGCEGGWVVFKAVMVVLSIITCFLLPLVLWAGSKLYDYWKGRGVQTL